MEIARLLYTPEEAGESLGVGRRQIYEMLRRGEIESVKVGRLRRIPADALEEYVARLRGDAA